MKIHILSLFKQITDISIDGNVYYDYNKQISFLKSDNSIPAFCNKSNGTSFETFTIEDSDPDEFHLYGKSTMETRILEDSDIDEFAII